MEQSRSHISLFWGMGRATVPLSVQTLQHRHTDLVSLTTECSLAQWEKSSFLCNEIIVPVIEFILSIFERNRSIFRACVCFPGSLMGGWRPGIQSRVMLSITVSASLTEVRGQTAVSRGSLSGLTHPSLAVSRRELSRCCLAVKIQPKCVCKCVLTGAVCWMWDIKLTQTQIRLPPSAEVTRWPKPAEGL